MGGLEEDIIASAQMFLLLVQTHGPADMNKISSETDYPVILA
jgi:hypothetical protein